MTVGRLAALLLADGRFPAGGHAHSAGVEPAVLDGRVHDLASLAAYVRGRLWSAALADAAMAAATVVALDTGASLDPLPALCRLDAEADARLASPALRAASRRLGRQLLRTSARCWPAPTLDQAGAAFPAGLHQAVALGAVAHAAGIDARGAAELAVHHGLTTPAQAAVRLLGIDPFAAAARVARLAPEAAAVVDLAVAASVGPLQELPAPASPMVDIASVAHAAADGRMFVS